MVATTKVFKSNKTQAVRLPKAVAFPPEVSEVTVTAVVHPELSLLLIKAGTLGLLTTASSVACLFVKASVLNGNNS